MKNISLLFLLFISILSCAQEKKELLGETDWQKEMNADFKDATKSPLLEKDREHFEGLEFFKFDSIYAVMATLKRTPDTEWFDMTTTTSRVSKERVYGIVTFILKGKTFKLNVYQGKNLMKRKGYEDYLFLPFLDNTNGGESYGGGRYIECRIPKSNKIIIDFNKAYNPYCAYDPEHSCPIVPRDNYVDEDIRAGVKAYVKH